MRTLVVYSSFYGHTEQIARVIASVIGAEAKRPVFGTLTGMELCTYDLLIVGSPTQDGKPLPSITSLLEAVPPDGLKDKKVAAFDTRHKWRWVGAWGRAAPRIATMLQSKGGDLVVPPEGFSVDSTKGPLFPAEIGRAADWARLILRK